MFLPTIFWNWYLNQAIVPDVLEGSYLHWGENKMVWSDVLAHELEKALSPNKNSDGIGLRSWQKMWCLETFYHKEATENSMF